MNECGDERVDEVEVSDRLELYIPWRDKGATPGRLLEKDGRGGDENEMAQRKEGYIPLPEIMNRAKYLTRTPFSHPWFHPCVVQTSKGVSKPFHQSRSSLAGTTIPFEYFHESYHSFTGFHPGIPWDTYPAPSECL